MPAHKSINLNTGAEMLTLGLGTWRSQPGEVEKDVAHALKHGYRHIDTATAYGNEKEVGEGIKKSGVPREQIFLTTKLGNPDHRKVASALEASLKTGRPDKGRDWRETWRGVQGAPGQVKAIGVSNVSVSYLQELLKIVTVVPAVNQIKSHLLCLQEDIVEECRKHGIAVTAYSPRGSDQAHLLAKPVVKRLSEKDKVAPSNILICLQAIRPSLTVIPKYITPHRIEENAKAVDLTEADIKKELFENHTRCCKPYRTGRGNIGFPD